MRDGGWKKPNNSLYGDFHRPSQKRECLNRGKNQSLVVKRLS